MGVQELALHRVCSEPSSEFPTMLRPFRSLFLAFGLCTVAVLALAQQPQMNLVRTKLSAGMHLLDVQVAQTPQERQIGLMFRKDMPQHEGMLFVFEQPATQCFWMKNTLIPLTAAFVADDGTIGRDKVAAAIKKYQLDPNKPNPMTV